MKPIQSKSGMSLIELVVALAIIAVLATVGVSHYGRMAARAKQSEAQNMLSHLYACMATFHQEWKYYFEDWSDIGFAPEGDQHYILGFSVPHDPLPAGIGYSGPSYDGAQPNPPLLGRLINNNNTWCGSALMNNCRTLPSAFAAAGHAVWGATDLNNTLGAQSWVAAASGQISGTAGSVDAWMINHQKQFTHVEDGSR